jgi:hypothetical protein
MINSKKLLVDDRSYMSEYSRCWKLTPSKENSALQATDDREKNGISYRIIFGLFSLLRYVATM